MPTPPVLSIGELSAGVEPGLMALFGVCDPGGDESMVTTQTHVFPLSAYIEMRSQLDACKVCYYIYLSIYIYICMYVCVYMCKYIYMAI